MYGNFLPKCLSLLVASFIFILLGVLFPIGKGEAASSSSGIATYVRINADKVRNGDIVSFSPQGYQLSSVPNDPNMSGVVLLQPAVSIVTKDERDMYPVVRYGSARVRVSGQNGSIRKGDLITSSTIPGLGMKTEGSGYVLGAALEDHKFAKQSDIAEIRITLDTHYYIGKAAVKSSFKDIFNLSMIATYNQPLTVLKYVMVVLIVGISFVSGFYVFQKMILKGIDSIGRNPLASHIIQLGMLVGIIVTIAVVFGGLFIAFLVLRL